MHTHHIGWTEFEEPQFLIYWVIKRMLDVRICEYCMKNVIRSYHCSAHTSYLVDRIWRTQFLIYWVIKRISDFRISEYMKNVIHIYKMTHLVFFKDGMPIFQGFTEKYVI